MQPPCELHMNLKHIMVIDDDKEDIEIFIEFISRCSYDVEVHFASECEEGLAVMRQLENIDIVFIDCRMPEVSGLQVMRLMKADIELKSIPVVIMSSSHSKYDEEMVLLAGACSYMVKSTDHHDYCSELYKVFGHCLN